MHINLVMSRMLVVNLVLGLLIVISAIGIVYAKYENRVAFIALEKTNKQRDKLTTEWGQLQLELSTWATHSRIEKIAHAKLSMRNVEFENIVFIKP